MFLAYFFHITFLSERPRRKIADKRYDIFFINFHAECQIIYKTVVLISMVKSNIWVHQHLWTFPVISIVTKKYSPLLAEKQYHVFKLLILFRLWTSCHPCCVNCLFILFSCIYYIFLLVCLDSSTSAIIKSL